MLHFVRRLITLFFTFHDKSQVAAGASDPRTAAAVAPAARHAARVDLPPAAVHDVRGVDGQRPLEGRGARVAGVRPAHLPPDGRGRRLPRHEARPRQLVGRREQLQHRALRRRGLGVHKRISLLVWPD